MENKINNWHALSDPALLNSMGKFVKDIRLQQNKTQQQVADAAGINRSTIVQIENGKGGTMLSFIQMLRALGQLQLLQHFVVQQQFSPLQLAKLEQKKRMRASDKKPIKKVKTTTDW